MAALEKISTQPWFVNFCEVKVRGGRGRGKREREEGEGRGRGEREEEGGAERAGKGVRVL
jgi:hypothetical protein